ALVFLDDDATRLAFWQRYQQGWIDHSDVITARTVDSFRHKWRGARARIERLVDECARGLERPATLFAPDRALVEHLRALRERIDAAHDAGALALVPAAATAAAARAQLLGSYLHMTNNRLGLGIPDEVYLAFLLEQGMSAH